MIQDGEHSQKKYFLLLLWNFYYVRIFNSPDCITIRLLPLAIMLSFSCCWAIVVNETADKSFKSESALGITKTQSIIPDRSLILECMHRILAER